MAGAAWQGNKRLNASIAPAKDADYTQMPLTFFISLFRNKSSSLRIFIVSCSVKAFMKQLKQNAPYSSLRGVSKGQPL